MGPLQFNRQQYMKKECDHDTYYGQFVTPMIVTIVKNRIGEARIRASQDPYFNDIPLAEWDAMYPTIAAYAGSMLGKSNASTHGGGLVYSLADVVCTAKAAAKRIRDSKPNLTNPGDQQ